MQRFRVQPTSHGHGESSDNVQPSFEKRLVWFELNATVAAAIAVSAIAIEALSALPSTSQKDIPASLRCSSLVLIALLASPIVDTVQEEKATTYGVSLEMSGFEFEQRGILMLLLLLVAIFGENHGDETIRVADAIFVLVAGWSIVLLFVLRSQKRTLGSTLVGSLLFYLGVRITAAAINHSYEVVTFVVTADRFDTRGYGLSDSVLATALTFGGTIVTCAGSVILVNDRAIRTNGSHFASPAIAQLAGLAFAAALIAQLSQYSRLDDLDVIFSTSACGGPGCTAARRARRLYIANSSTGPLWGAVVSLTVFATPKNRRANTPTEYFNSNPIPTVGGMVGAVTTVAIVAASIHFGNDELGYVTSELVVLYFSIPAVWFLAAPLGCALFIAGNGMYIHDRLGSIWGFDLRYWTHWSLATSGVLVSLLFVTTTLTWVAFNLKIPFVKNREALRLPPLEVATAALSIALFSLQLALTVTTLVLFASYDGSLVTSENSWREQGFEYSLQHSLSFFFAAALYGSRFELAERSVEKDTDNDARLRGWARRVSLYFLPIVTFVCWILTVACSRDGSPYGTSTSTAPFVVGLVASAVPWVVAGVGI